MILWLSGISFIETLCTTAENQLFAKFLNNSDHVLQKLSLPHIIQITISDTETSQAALTVHLTAN